MRRLLVTAACILAVAAPACAQTFPGQYPNNTVSGNVSGGNAAPAPLTATQLTTLCNAFTTSLSGCVTGSGGGTTNFLRADGSWAAPAGTGITALTGDVTASGTGSVAATIAANAVTNAKLATATQNTVKGAATSTAEADLTMSSCSATGSALKWTTNTGFGCQSTLADLAAADQTLSGGANVTAASNSTGNLSIDCGKSPLQTITNGGAWTLTAPSNDASCVLLVTNNGTAGATSLSGFSPSTCGGDAVTTTNTSKFFYYITRIGGTSTCFVRAAQ